MNNVWTEEDIRKELDRLYAKTRQNSAGLTINFSNAKCTLGQYSSTDRGSFRFSNHYYQDPTWPIEEALDTIWHEYAHYMAHMIYGNLSLGSIRKNIVGA